MENEKIRIDNHYARMDGLESHVDNGDGLFSIEEIIDMNEFSWDYHHDDDRSSRNSIYPSY